MKDVIKNNCKWKLKKKKVESNFIFIPRQNPEIIPDILAECDVAYLSFSNNELFNKTIPAKLQSYMACGMPLIASAQGEVDRIINEADCGLCVENGNSDKLASAILKLEKMDLSVFSLNSRKYFEKNFEKSILLDRFDTFIKNIK
ncbi:glycosyltransferase [Streptococcus uberis]|nr:glycosyltransferase [Streptococcus uberis]MCK1203304.1 glycosyltransferase [Streptococcus uberis]